MPYADPEIRKQKDKEYKSRPDVMERNRELYRERYASNATGTADKVRARHHSRWQDPEYREQKRQQYLKRWEKDWSGQALIQIRARCKKTGQVCEIDASDIPLPEKCPVFGTPLIKSNGRMSNDSPSVDRIDNSKGYVKGNVVVVSLRANSIKREATLDELRKLVAFYEGFEK